LPEAAASELQLYSRGLLRAPSIFLSEEEHLGSERRAGVVDVDAGQYGAFLETCHRLFFDPHAMLALRDKLDGIERKLLHSLAKAEQAAAGISDVVDITYDLMAFHLTNWILPMEEFERFIAHILGDPHLATRVLLDFLVPRRPAYMLDFHSRVLEAAGFEVSERGKVADVLARSIGYLHGRGMPGLEARPMEKIETAIAMLAATGSRGKPALDAELAALEDAHKSAIGRRAAMYSATLLLATREPGLYQGSQAIATVCQLATDAEERRKVLQNRVLRLFRRSIRRRGLDPMSTLIEEFAD
jgi:hypothetical protein